MEAVRKVFMGLLIAVLTAVFVISGYRAWQILQERQAAKTVYEKLDTFVHFSETDGDEGIQETETGSDEGISAEQPAVDFPEVDFDSLRSINEQVVGWIYDENTVINYPIAQARDNEYYLYYMFNGGRNSNGCIFLDCQNQSDFSDSHCIIYGHDMKSGAMFAALANYKSQEYFEEHPRVLLMTPDQNYTIDFFAGYVANVEDDAWTTVFLSEADYEAWIASSIEKSILSSDIVPSASDHVITLSTCSYEFADARFVLLGVLRAQ